MRNKVSIDEYLAFLSTKYEVDADNLFHAMISAGENQQSSCGDLLIKCRAKLKDRIILLITKEAKVVTQFSIPKEFLTKGNNPLKNIGRTDKLHRRLAKKENEPRNLQIRDLRTGMKQIKLKARVVEIGKPTMVFTRFGTYASVTNALIADETGTIKLCLWNEQTSAISVGNTVQVENARVSMFRGERQLRIGKNGTLNIIENLATQ